ncbi:MAG: branched-chain amino acid ABC transporter permease [Dehalococcoidia bacterium]|nr:MAG: branched-chain amino acid ABC transporter permease [Dehalococcoidia bacterium]
MAVNRPCGTFNENYAKDMAIVRTKFQWGLVIASLILLFALPSFCSSLVLYLVNLIAITLIAVLGLNILTGYTGLFSLGQAAFMGVGAYTSALLTTYLGFSFWLALPCAGLSAALVGVIFGLPSLRIKGFYLTMATLAAQFIIPWLFIHVRPDLTGGTDSLLVAVPTLGNIKFNSQASMFYIIIPTMLVMLLFAKNIVRTSVGRAFIAIRDNDLAAEVMGVNLFKYKLLAFFICSFYAGIAGSLWAHWMRAILYEHFLLMQSIWMCGMVIVGGMGYTVGAVFGTVFIRLLDQFVVYITPVVEALFPHLVGSATAAVGPFAFGSVIVVFIIFEPRGLAHRWEMFKASYRLNPYSY